MSELKKQGKRADLVAAVAGSDGKGRSSDASSSDGAGKRGSGSAGTSRGGVGNKLYKTSAGGGRKPSADSNKNSKGGLEKVARGGNASSRSSSGSSKSVHDVCGGGGSGDGNGGVGIQVGGASRGVGSEGARGGASAGATEESNAMTDWQQQQRAVMSDGSRGEGCSVKGPGGVVAEEATKAGSRAKKRKSDGEI